MGKGLTAVGSIFPLCYKPEVPPCPLPSQDHRDLPTTVEVGGLHMSPALSYHARCFQKHLSHNVWGHLCRTFESLPQTKVRATRVRPENQPFRQGKGETCCVDKYGRPGGSWVGVAAINS